MILLTGATGYLGSRIAQELAARRLPFRVLVRSRSRLSFDASTAGAEVVEGDLRDADAVGLALQGVDRVIHTAALVKMWVRDRADFRRVNVDGLKALVEAAHQAGVERVIYTSSFIALGPSADASAGEGLRHHGPYSNEYEQTKVEALAWLRAEGFTRYRVLALMPGVIYGPGPLTEGNLVGGMASQYLAGKFPGLLGSGNQRWSFAFNDDVVAAHLAALDRGKPGEEYVLGGDNRSLNDLFQVLAELSGVRRPVRHLPFAVGKIVGALELAKANLFGRSPQLTPGVVEIFKHDWIYSSAKAERELGYHVTRLEDGLKKTLGSAMNR
ncbi:MAG TPA: NAD-dependent epimerase/dehydratase family protein [Terriglobia bacterium]|nr:NAD-dependent epimerase/dehydratase family protein [Terriglobia bacterium]